MDLNYLVPGVVAFDWDENNIDKNWHKHKVHFSECEDVFFNDPIIEVDPWHSQNEQRYLAYGTTDKQRLLFAVFTIRKGKIRIISARGMSRKERRMFDEKAKKDT